MPGARICAAAATVDKEARGTKCRFLRWLQRFGMWPKAHAAAGKLMRRSERARAITTLACLAHQETVAGIARRD